MTQAVSIGFCHYCHHADPLASLDELRATQETLWQRPVLQLLDIQRFMVDKETPSGRFYLALSDSRHCVWAIVPPESELEAAIHDGTVECGCLITIFTYVIVAAKCGKCVMVILDATYSATPFSLIGEPSVNATWMPLSSKSLIKQRSEALAAASAASAARLSTRYQRHFTDRLLHEFFPENGVVMLDPMDRWAVSGRVLWKSKLRKTDTAVAAAPNRFATSHSPHEDNRREDGGFRYVFDCVLVDQRGDAMRLVFWGCRRFYDVVERGSCIRACDGIVKRSANNEPLYLSFQERSIVEPLAEGGSDGEGDDCFLLMPEVPLRLLGSCAEPFLSVLDVVSHRGVGDVVTVQGLVVSVQPCVQIRTVRGTVDKATLTLRDAQRSGGGGGPTIEVTLWDDAARTCRAAPGQLWCLRDVTVRFFGSVKQLSTRASSELFELPLAFLETGDPTTVFAATSHKDPQDSRTRRHLTTAGPPSRFDEPRGQEGAPFFFELCHAVRSETTFVLCRIHHIKLPLFYVACTSCGAQMKGVACLACSLSTTELRFLLRMDISDGVESISSVVGFTSVAEALFGETTASFLTKASADSRFAPAAVAELNNFPVLMKIAKSGTGILHVLELKHVDLAKTARAVASAIDAFH
jgi:hypothetical protein